VSFTRHFLAGHGDLPSRQRVRQQLLRPLLFEFAAPSGLKGHTVSIRLAGVDAPEVSLRAIPGIRRNTLRWHTLATLLSVRPPCAPQLLLMAPLAAFSREAFDFLALWTKDRRVCVEMLRKDHVGELAFVPLWQLILRAVRTDSASPWPRHTFVIAARSALYTSDGFRGFSASR
jgi:hypothetical protein